MTSSLNLSIPPTHPTNLTRLRLINRLNNGATRQLTVISAPPGYGKTTLLAQWAAQAPQKAVWLAVDKSDNDPARFLKNFISALQRVHADIGKDVFKKLQAENKPSIEAVLKRVIDEIALVMQDFVIVLEDYHLIDAEPVHNIIMFFLEYLPPQMHLFISGETDPPLKLSALRANELLMEIRTPYLAFTMDEATACFNEVMGLKLPYGDVTAVVSKAEANPAVLMYLARCLKDASGKPEEFIKELEQVETPPLDFALEILFNRQPERIREFLLRISILDEFNEPLCQAVSGINNSSDILDSLEKEGLFIFPLDAQKRWFGIHKLIRKYLQERLQSTEAGNVRHLHLRACLWNAQNQQVERAFHHALAAGDFSLAGQFIEQNAQEMLQRGELVTVDNWLNELPDDTFATRPMLSVSRAWVLIITQRYDEVEPHLEDALQAKQHAADPEEIVSHVNAIREFLSAQK